MSNYLAIVRFPDGESLLTIYNNTSDNVTTRSLITDTAEAREYIDGGDRDETSRFEELHLQEYRETEWKRERRVVNLIVQGKPEPVTILVPGCSLSFHSEALRTMRFLTGATAMPD